MKIQKIKKKNTYEIVLEQLKDLIVNKELKPGEKLPGERDLAKEFQVSRTSIRIALKLLAFMNFVEIKPGKGIFVASNSRLKDTFARVEWIGSFQRNPLIELIEARKGIEPYMAELAAIHATEEDISEMEKELEKMALSIQRKKYGIEEASCFHEMIFKASGNLILRQIGENLKSLMYESKKVSMKEGNRAHESLSEHRGILEAIKERNPELARQRMFNHLINVEKNLR